MKEATFRGLYGELGATLAVSLVFQMALDTKSTSYRDFQGWAILGAASWPFGGAIYSHVLLHVTKKHLYT